MSFSTGGTSGAVTGGTERMRIDSSGNVGIGTSSPVTKLTVTGGNGNAITSTNTGQQYSGFEIANNGTNKVTLSYDNTNGIAALNTRGANPFTFGTADTERMRIDSSGDVLVGTTNGTPAISNVKGAALLNAGSIHASRDGGTPVQVNRKSDDGVLVDFRQDGTSEGNISVSGTTVSYNGGHLSRWSQLPDNSKDDTILKGTVLTNLDDMCVWTKDGEVLLNEQLNKMQVSSVEGDTNVAGVFVNWTRDEDCNTDDMNVAMTGDMIIRIADGVVVQKGDLLMSAGDGTAKPQGDDIVRSKTVAKVTSNHVTCTYADGSYCVPCVLMAC
jgi:hypothetical protein